MMPRAEARSLRESRAAAASLIKLAAVRAHYRRPYVVDTFMSYRNACAYQAEWGGRVDVVALPHGDGFVSRFAVIADPRPTRPRARRRHQQEAT